MKTLPATDVVIIGGGWTGLLMAKELGSRTPQSIVVLERGGPRRQSDYVRGMDELDYFVRLHMMQDPAQETVTVRHDAGQPSLPIRQFANFLPGTGVGGTGEHWGAQVPRFQPDCYQLYSTTVARYGTQKLPAGHSFQDWGVTYDEIEPYYTRTERTLGVSGKAGNIRGTKIAGGNIFDGWHSEEYPNPPLKNPYYGSLLEQAALALGYHPYPNPTAINSRPYTNPDGVARAGCAYCGFCERLPCMIAAKAQPSNTFLPLVQGLKGVSVRTGATVRRIVHDGTRAAARTRGVTYVDASGAELFQPADLVILASYTLSNNRLLMLSGTDEQYDPATGKATLGKNLTHQVSFTAATVFFDKPLNRFMGAGGAGRRFADFDGDVFDHSKLPFLRGGIFGAIMTGTAPIATFGVLPPSIKASWGSEWKQAALRYYDNTALVAFSGEHVPYAGNYFDLDSTYRDSAGDPLLRMTVNWRDNERRMVEFMTAKGVEVARVMGAREIAPNAGYRDYDVTRYQSTHVQGGTMMAPSPDRGIVNTFQQHWRIPNLFVLGASTFPNSGSANPTPTILAFAYRTADALVDRYLKRPGPLA
jgi:gluconate 2-dehydrogenase alpha chain